MVSNTRKVHKLVLQKEDTKNGCRQRTALLGYPEAKYEVRT